jgi:serine/threonine-protein kinase
LFNEEWWDYKMIVKGQKINDRYEIIRSIGEGGMANVYLALDTILDRRVAVKVLRGDLANDEKFVRRFQREAISASSLSHPNIVEMYDVGEDNGNYFIVMEYVEGKSLKSLIKKRGGLTLPEVLDIMLQLTDGIACAHNSYIIHRDIKPQNILVLDDGRVKITDFGIAQALKRGELTETNSVMGSVHYLPPEQANGTGTTIKSDIYSLGIVMFELLTGKVPFKGENAVEIALKQMKEPMPSIHTYKEGIPQSIENIILKAAAKNPKNRYDTVLEMQEDIKTALSKDREDEQKIVFRYAESDQEQEQEKETISRTEKNAELEEIFEKEKEKKSNKKLWIIGLIIMFIAFIICFVIFALPSFKKVPNVKVPNVENMEVSAAIRELEQLGFVVEAKTEEQYSDTIEAGKVIKTNPQADRTVKKGTSIQVTVSLGLEGFLSENYVGKNYIEVKTMLETRGLKVTVEEKEYTEKEAEEAKVKENTVVSQDIKEGIELKKGETVTLTIPKIVVTYPDFTDGTWTTDKVKEFCDKQGIKLEVKTVNTNDHPDNTIITQDRASESKVVKGVKLTITVTKKLPEPKPDEDKPGEGTQNPEPENPTNPTDPGTTDQPTGGQPDGTTNPTTPSQGN